MTTIENTIDTDLRNLVRINSGAAATSPEYAWEQQATIIDVGTSELPRILPERLLHSQIDSLGVPEQVFSVLTNKRFRRGTYEQVATYSNQLLGQISAAVDEARPIELVLPTIPFKDQSPVTTGQAPDAIDLGEHAMVAQIRDLLFSIQEVYSPGAVMHLVSDGHVYRAMCHTASDEQISGYGVGVQALINNYGLTDSITMTNFADIVQADHGFLEDQLRTFDVLRHKLETDNPYLRTLQRAMLGNMALEGMDIQDIVRFQQSNTNQWPARVAEATGAIACEYAAFLLTAARRRVLEHRFPGCLRATVHPKDAPQIPLNLVNRRSMILPYNGVPVVDSGDTTLRNSLRIVRLVSLLGSKRTYIKHLSDSGNALFYETI